MPDLFGLDQSADCATFTGGGGALPSARATAWPGSRHEIIVPRPGVESIVTLPPCSSTRLLTNDRPSPAPDSRVDRKSTRLNSSHANISYAVFCLKKKKRQKH